eukprot:scaffold9852_cov112-Isochrysis_galbana.AAC.3
MWGVQAKAFTIRALIHARERSGATHPQRLLNRTNHTIGPLFHLDPAGTLSITERMAKRLDVAQMGHIGKNIRILTHDEHAVRFTSVGSSRRWRGAIVTLHAHAEFFYSRAHLYT